MHSERKHAYLIMAHSNFSILKKLLKLLDDRRNDIFIHIDKKVGEFDIDAYRAQCVYASVLFVSDRDRIDVGWGRSSTTDAEMLLFSMAYSHGPYAYYHLISGGDLPLKTQDEIHSFFRDRSENFIAFVKKPTVREYERLSLFYHIPARGKLIRRCEKYLRGVQRLLKVDRFKKWEKKGYNFGKGSSWVSLTGEAVGILLREKKTIYKMTRFSDCADEEYKQIILKKAGVPIYLNEAGDTDNLRLIDWSRGTSVIRTLSECAILSSYLTAGNSLPESSMRT